MADLAPGSLELADLRLPHGFGMHALGFKMKRIHKPNQSRSWAAGPRGAECREDVIGTGCVRTDSAATRGFARLVGGQGWSCTWCAAIIIGGKG